MVSLHNVNFVRHILFKLSTLRIISYSIDYEWAYKNKYSNSGFDHKKVCEICKHGNKECLKYRSLEP